MRGTKRVVNEHITELRQRLTELLHMRVIGLDLDSK